MAWMDNMTEQEKQEWLDAGTIADQIWDDMKRNGKPQTLRENLLEYEANHRMLHW